MVWNFGTHRQGQNLSEIFEFYQTFVNLVKTCKNSKNLAKKFRFRWFWFFWSPWTKTQVPKLQTLQIHSPTLCRDINQQHIFYLIKNIWLKIYLYIFNIHEHWNLKAIYSHDSTAVLPYHWCFHSALPFLFARWMDGLSSTYWHLARVNSRSREHTIFLFGNFWDIRHLTIRILTFLLLKFPYVRLIFCIQLHSIFLTKTNSQTINIQKSSINIFKIKRAIYCVLISRF